MATCLVETIHSNGTVGAAKLVINNAGDNINFISIFSNYEYLKIVVMD